MDSISSFILGSGMLENPNIVPASFFFILACLISFKALKTLEKDSEKKRRVVYVHVVLMIISLIIAFRLIAEGSAEQAEKSQPAEEEVENTTEIMKSVTL